MLIGCAGGDGNVLLDVGPTPTGEIPAIQVARLKEIGAWFAKYGAGIRGTRGGPYKPGEYGTSTRRGNTVYIHIRNWDADSVQLPALPAHIVRSRVLTGGTVAVAESLHGIRIGVPAKYRKDLDTIVALDLDRPASEIASMDVPAMPCLTTGAKATASNVFQNSPEYGPEKAVDGRGDTRWATDAGTHQAWLELDMGKPVTFDRVVVLQAFPELKRIRAYAVEYWEDGAGKACYRGTNMGAKLAATFKAVTAQRVRLNITDATDGPTIWEFKLFGPE
jgi:alpha-L-fucosidase